MTGKTHLNGGLLASLIFCSDIPSGLLVTFGSILPDIDHASSFLGKNIPLIHKLFKHRGFTHSLLFCVVIFLLNKWIAYGVAVHILLDTSTKNGVKLFWPSNINIRFPFARFIKTNGKFEKLLFIFISCGILFEVINRFIYNIV